MSDVIVFTGPFGSFLVRYGDQSLSHLRVRSAQALLVLLAVEGRAQQREQLVELLWPGMPLSSGRKNLRQTLYELRQLFPEVDAREGAVRVPLLLADRQTISLNPQAAVALDTTRFDAFMRARDAQALRQAVALYRGDFLSDFFLPDSSTFETWVSGWRAAYRREMLEALGSLAEQAFAAGDYAQALQYSQQALELDDLRETAVRQLMRTLTAMGRRAEALQIYFDLQQRLHDILDVAPALDTTALYESIRAQGELVLAGGPVVSERVTRRSVAEPAAKANA